MPCRNMTSVFTRISLSTNIACVVALHFEYLYMARFLSDTATIRQYAAGLRYALEFVQNAADEKVDAANSLQLSLH